MSRPRDALSQCGKRNEKNPHITNKKESDREKKRGPQE